MSGESSIETTTLKDDLLVGVKAIAEFRGETERRTYHLIATGQLQGVWRQGARYYARKSTMLENIRRLERGEAA